MLLGNVIQEKRKSMNLNQTELSDGICTQAIISKIENQNIAPSISILISICQKLNLTLDQVFSEFSSLPSSNLVQDKFEELDAAMQSNNYSKLQSNLPTIKESALPSSQKAHLHFLWAALAKSKNDFDEAIFQLNYSLDILTNRNSFWGNMIYSELGQIYLEKSQETKTAYYFDLAYSSIDVVVSSSFDYFYYRTTILRLANWYSEKQNYQKSDELINLGLHKFDKFFTAKFTDQLYFLSAVNILKKDPINYNKLSHALTTAIAFADYNNNTDLMDQIKQLMSSHNINELKIKP
ncbi:helix-turn-helix domain-containing protein [Companilactobacillus baiquanensis]|uniref:Helix-turn-helix domain-containing protein n=1 Tax=Companilactobacillus baiquanensis TaxID=2486005 RepID=A0ABW1UUY8_9LACO|nr:helix-turn-helix transcriptional regulator [Companilactobacillus baiquanensis]